MVQTLTLPEIEQALRIQKHQASLSPPANTLRNARATHTDSISKKSSNYTQKREAWGNSWWSACLPAILSEKG